MPRRFPRKPPTLTKGGLPELTAFAQKEQVPFRTRRSAPVALRPAERNSPSARPPRAVPTQDPNPHPPRQRVPAHLADQDKH
ncbi:hypothetical protein Ate02nite_58080 [Paractinoplanes tereljensis]|uniref:Uncharacterized protein n=1 Tax=Paractinoplanes tereljensis TaxID=571912 RepID=A0A919NR03_9ACTN|nr:hypothetical protein Ate02nite_58080 [Actinoplanes tereljensis]